jgi:hypothetical protein
MPIPRPPALTEGYRHNFDTLERAWRHGDVALVCAMQQNDDDTITPVPFAVMCEGNPFEDFEDPTVL